MRILHITYIYPPKLRVADGITDVAYNVTKDLVKRGHEVTVYTSNMLDLKGKYSIRVSGRVIDGVKVHYSRSSWKYKTFIVTPWLLPLLSRNAEQFDIIHIHDCRSFQGIIAYLFAEMRKIPYILQPHGSYLSALPASVTGRLLRLALDELVSRRIVRKASKVIALSRFEADLYKMFGIPEEKITVIPNGIDFSEYANLPARGSFKKKFGVKENEKIVLYVGRLHESKGLAILAQAFKIVSKVVSEARLVVVGPDDGYATAFSKLVADLGIKNKVLLTGFIDKSDKMAAFVDGDVFVTPVFSGFPVTFLEACLAGCPIVTSSGDLNWIHENVGYVVENSLLINAICKILQDKGVQEKFRNNCKREIRNFEISATTSHLETVYKSIIRKDVGTPD